MKDKGNSDAGDKGQDYSFDQSGMDQTILLH